MKNGLWITYEEADVLSFLASSFLDDNRGNRTNLGTIKRESYSHQVVRKLNNFSDISKRCGVLGPRDSTGDYPRCTRKRDGHKTHKALDIHTMTPIYWHGDKTKQYLESFRVSKPNKKGVKTP